MNEVSPAAYVEDFSHCAGVLWASQDAIERAFLASEPEGDSLMEILRRMQHFEWTIRAESLSILLSRYTMGDMN